jgi:6,7-dimethyl-8-ribityllumazine synthase
MSDPDLREQPPRWPPSLEPDEEMPAFRRAEPLPEPETEPAPEAEPEPEHAAGDFRIPDGYAVIEGSGDADGRSVGIVVAKFNGEITRRLLQRALDELEEAGIERDAVTIVPVPGAFELPLAAMALAKTRKYACIIALGCVIRGDTPHFDFVAGEAASGLQLAAIETGVPVSFGVLTTETTEQAEARIDRAADAVQGALEMARLFAELRAAAK